VSRYATPACLLPRTHIFDRGSSEAPAEPSGEPEAPKEESVGWDSQTLLVEPNSFLTEGREESRKEGCQADCCEGRPSAVFARWRPLQGQEGGNPCPRQGG